jgi:hypothetical protein
MLALVDLDFPDRNVENVWIPGVMEAEGSTL